MKICRIVVIITAFVLGSCAAKPPSKSQSALALIESADRYYSMGLLSDAEAKYRKITLAYPKYHEAWLKLGNIYVRTDQLEAAIIAYQTCNQKQPEDVRCWNNLALARVKQAVSSLDEGKSAVMRGSSEYIGLEQFQRRLIGVLSPKS